MNTSILSAFAILSAIFLFSCSHNAPEKAKATNVNTSDSSYVVELTATDYAFGMPSEIKSGWVKFRFTNNGSFLHNVNVMKMPDSLSTDSVENMLLNYDFSFIETSVGGPGVHAPGSTSSQTLHLKAGSYLLFCARIDKEQTPHLNKGMYHFFEVTKKEAKSAEPESNVQIVLTDKTLGLKGQIIEGTNTFGLQFKDGIKGGFHLVNLNKTGDLNKALLGLEVQPQQMKGYLGGSEPADTGRKVFMTFDLEKGRYAWLSYGYSSFGMYQVFEVPGVYSPDSTRIKPDTTMHLTITDGKLPENNFKLNSSAARLSFQNTDSVAHQVEIQRLKPGFTVEDVYAFHKRRGEDENGNYLENPLMGTYLKFPNKAPGSEGEIVTFLRDGNYVLYNWNAESDLYIESLHLLNVKNN